MADPSSIGPTSIADKVKLIRDLAILIGIYLYFIAWVYIHFYYAQFGISTESINIDYSTYLVYSYNVLLSGTFLYWLILFIGILLLRIVILQLLKTTAKKYSFINKIHSHLSGNLSSENIFNINKNSSLFLLIFLQLIIFPLLFRISRTVALENYREDRMHKQYLKSIQFIFRSEAELLSPAVILDSTISKSQLLYNDIKLLKNDKDQLLRLLGESDKYYIVLHQLPYNDTLKALPTGYVYYIDKSDVLLTRIILRTK